MSAVVTGVVVSSLATGYSISSSEKAKKTAKHAKDRAVGRSRELADKARRDTAASKATALEDRRKRSIGVGRNLNLFGGSMNDAAQRAKKSLTGQ